MHLRWNRIGNQLKKALEAVNIKVYALSSNVYQRSATLEAFAKEPKSVLLLSLENDPSGMNLVAANHCLLVHPMSTSDPEQAAAWEKQAIGRICRQLCLF